MSEWRQIKITADMMVPKEEDDCYLSPEDPAWDHMGIPKRAEPTITINTNNGSEKARIMREQDIKPGTEAWFKLWFSRK
jgi:hypothetical protein